MLRHLGLILLTAPLFPMLIHSRKKKPEPDLEAIDRVLDRIRRGPVTLHSDEEVAIREVLAFISEQELPDSVQWAVRRLREVERRCAV